MNILTIDTSTRVEIIAAETNNKISDQTKRVDISHSVTIFESIQNALEKINIGIAEINLIGVGIGPGSFTGIRIAVATARMLSQLLEAPLVGVKTHLIWAASINKTHKTSDYILIAFDAKKGRVFGALYKKTNNIFSPDEIVPPGDYYMENLLEAVEGNKALAAGDGAEKYIEIINKKIPGCELLSDFIPSGEAACMLIRLLYEKNPEGYMDYNSVKPFYSRKADAEIFRALKP